MHVEGGICTLCEGACGGRGVRVHVEGGICTLCEGACEWER